ncbi:hypothetical protein PAPYR_5159 [Paratrimastix pyriformis]|uniref:Uncharacterized protein n=1 Tax=Paratrimastix pyriformis TaxID=342808 RepID=A0ABQ8UI53_9EUKA|nr:hypothetical protein PAPYR_5159 [Paratrimastix pyriformis]
MAAPQRSEPEMLRIQGEGVAQVQRAGLPPGTPFHIVDIPVRVCIPGFAPFRKHLLFLPKVGVVPPSACVAASGVDAALERFRAAFGIVDMGFMADLKERTVTLLEEGP